MNTLINKLLTDLSSDKIEVTYTIVKDKSFDSYTCYELKTDKKTTLVWLSNLPIEEAIEAGSLGLGVEYGIDYMRAWDYPVGYILLVNRLS